MPPDVSGLISELDLDKTAAKHCVDCSSSQQIKCFGIDVVSQGISKNKKCNKHKTHIVAE
jgi:hypothetical protein